MPILVFPKDLHEEKDRVAPAVLLFNFSLTLFLQMLMSYNPWTNLVVVSSSKKHGRKLELQSLSSILITLRELFWYLNPFQ